MSTFVIHPETRETPAEYGSTQPTTCALCGQTWDADDDADRYATVNGNDYCRERLDFSTPTCAAIALERSYRREAGQQLADALEEASNVLAALDVEYPNEIQDFGHPYQMLEDLKTRTVHFAAGRDNGWRAGLMLDEMETYELRVAIRAVLGLAPYANAVNATPISQPAAIDLSRLRDHLLLLERAETRTTHPEAA